MSDREQADSAADLTRAMAGGDPEPDPIIAEWGDDTCLWLAAVPRWTIEVAERAGLPLPRNVDSVEELVVEGAAAGILRSRTDPGPDGGLTDVFWMHGDTAREWLADLRGRRGAADLVEEVRRVAALLGRQDDLPAITVTWRDLVDGEQIPNVTVVVDDVRGLVQEDRLAEASRLTDAGAAVAAVLEGDYPDGITRARRLIDQGYRRRRDQLALARFVARDEQTTPVAQMLAAGPSQPWALHLMGPGGVGKTSLVRFVATGGLTGGESLSIARIDFDTINPDFPVTRPVQLLMLLADNLASAADTVEREAALRSFTAAAHSAHVAATGRATSSAVDLVERATALFGTFLASLAVPQVLILDTCEELARLQLPGEEAVAVTRTFDLLEGVHRACPTVRVVLAGRRHLARAGHGWVLPDGIDSSSVASLSKRSYLRLLELRGFDEPTARAVLASPLRTGREPAPDVVEAILRRSPEQTRPGCPPDPARYNPFEIVRYREWWEDDPGLSADAVRTSGTRAYVRRRVIDRLRSEVLEDLLPALALLGRLDELILGDCLPESQRPDVDRVLAELAAQEWVELQTDLDTNLRVVNVALSMRPLLAEWAEHERTAQMRGVREALAGSLATRLREADLDTLTPELVAAAARLSDPDDVVTGWQRVEEAIETSGRWGWAEVALPRIRGMVEDLLPNDPALDAVLLATALVTQLRISAESVTDVAWRHVHDVAGRARAGPALQLLQARCSVAALARMPAPPDAVVRDLLLQMAGRGEPLADLIGAIEMVLGDVPSPSRQAMGVELGVEVREAADAATAALAVEDPALLAGGLTVLSTLCAGPRALELLEEAAAYARSVTPRRTWSARPAHDRRDPRTWVALHRAAMARVAELPVGEEQLRQWSELALGDPGTDADRLASACLDLTAMLGRSEARTQLVRRLVAQGKAEDYRPGAAVGDDVLHGETPPLFVAVSRLHFRNGRPLAATAVLERWRDAAVASRSEDATVMAADLELVRLAARMRWPRFRPSFVARVRASGAPGAAETCATLGLLADNDAGPEPPVGSGSVDRDLQMAVELVTEPSEELFARVRVRAETIRQRDPVTACHLLTDLVRARRRLTRSAGGAAPDELEKRVVRDLRVLYTDVGPPDALPAWGEAVSGAGSGGPWSAWCARWAEIDGSATASAGSTEPPSRRALAVAGPVGALLMLFTVLLAAGTVMAAGVPVLARVLGAALGVSALAAAIVLVNGLRPSAVLLRRTYASVTVIESVVKADFRSLGTLGALLAGGVPRQTTTPAGTFLPLHGWSVARAVAAVLDQTTSRDPQDWETRLLDPADRRSANCVLVRDVQGPEPDRWSRGVRLRAGPWTAQLLDAYRQPDPGAITTARVQHLLGDPIETSTGPILHIGGSASAHGDEFWTPATAGSRARLTVVQQTPVERAPDSPRDTVAARLLREIALEQARDAGGWVLCIPALPGPVAEQVWVELARFGLDGDDWGGPAVAVLVRQVKKIIAAADGTALDVVVAGPWSTGRM